MEKNDLKVNTAGLQDNKSIAIIAYITWIGLLVAFIMNKDKQDPFVKFHIRQNLGLFVIGILSGLLNFIPTVGAMISYVVFAILFVLWIIGLLGAFSGKTNPIPVVGPMFQDWFKGI